MLLRAISINIKCLYEINGVIKVSQSLVFFDDFDRAKRNNKKRFFDAQQYRKPFIQFPDLSYFHCVLLPKRFFLYFI